MLLQSQILFEDTDIIVVYKPAGVATQTSKVGQPDMVSEVKNYIVKNNSSRINAPGQPQQGARSMKPGKGGEPYLALIHRLDQPVEGILVMAKTPAAAVHLNKQLTEHMMDKHYLAAVCGKAPCVSATVVDYLLKDEKTNLSRIVDQGTEGAKKAVLEFEVVNTVQKAGSSSTDETAVEKEHTLSLLSIHLITGRHHQIRVQMSGANMPLLGDQKYGGEEVQNLSKTLGIRTVALCSNKLSFMHPITQERLTFEVQPKGSWYRLFS